LLIEWMIGVKTRIKLSASARFVGKELKGLAHMILDQSVVGVVVELSARTDTDVEKVDNHGGLVGIITVSTKVALIVGANPTTVHGSRRRCDGNLGRFVVGAARSTELGDVVLALRGIGIVDFGQIDGLESTRLTVAFDDMKGPLDILESALAKIAKGTRVVYEQGEK